jgi:PAS domain S-box-containing protein
MKQSLEKILLLFLIIIIIGRMTAAYSTWKEHKRQIDYNHFITHSEAVLHESEQVLSIVSAFESGTRGYIITGDSSFLSPSLADESIIAHHLDKLKQLYGANPTQQQRIDAMQNLIYASIVFSKEAVVLRNTKGYEAAVKLVAGGKGKLYLSKINDEDSAIQQEENNLLTQRTKSHELSSVVFDRSFYFYLVCTLVLIILAFFIIRTNLIYRKKIEQDLFIKNEWYTQTMLSLGDGVIATDTRGVITLINKAACELTGWKEEEAIGNHIDTIFEITHERTGVKVINPVIVAMEQNKIVLLSNHSILKRKNGEPMFIDDSGAPINNNAGELIGAVLIFRDITEKEKAEKSIIESEAKFRSFYENSMDGIFLTAPDGRILSANAAACAIFKTTEEDLCKAGSDGFVDASDARLAKVMEERKNHGKVRGELTMIRKNGEKFQAEISSSIFKDRFGEGRAFLIINDITGRKKAEDQIKLLNETLEKRVEERTREVIEKEMRYKETLDNMLEGVQIIAYDWSYLYVNDCFVKQSKYSKEELLGHTLMEKYPNIENTKLFRILQRCQNERINQHLEAELIFPDNSWGWFELSIEAVPEGLFVLSIDITERKKAREKIRASELMLLETQAIAHIGSWEWDIANNITYWTDELFRIYGFKPHEFEPSYEKLLKYIHTDDMEMVQNALQQSLEEHQPFSFYYKIVTPDNGIRTLYGRGTLFVNENDEQIMKGLVEDVTDRKEAEEEVLRKNIELQKTNSELDRFVYSASHDLRAPLLSLLGLINISSIEAIAEDLPQKERLGMMRRTILKLDNFIKDILHYSRNSRTEVANDEIDFEEMITEIRESLKFMESTTKCKLEVEINQKGIFLSDKRRIEIVLNNIISNAIKYQGTTTENPFVHISIKADEQGASIAIEDNGIGIAEEDKEKIFEMFYRATKYSTGAGLGMYIAKEIIEKLHGTIAVESELKKGSRFLTIIPNQLKQLKVSA